LRKAVLTAVAVALAAVAVAVAFVLTQEDGVDSVADLDRGDCVDAAAFRAGEQPARADLERTDCDGPHDAEVLRSVELSADQAEAYRPVVPDLVCTDVLKNDADTAVSDQRLLVTGVADSPRPAAGDTLVCFGSSADGARLGPRVKPR
jgi:hypothetical protein